MICGEFSSDVLLISHGPLCHSFGFVYYSGCLVFLLVRVVVFLVVSRGNGTAVVEGLWVFPRPLEPLVALELNVCGEELCILRVSESERAELIYSKNNSKTVRMDYLEINIAEQTIKCTSIALYADVTGTFLYISFKYESLICTWHPS